MVLNIVTFFYKNGSFFESIVIISQFNFNCNENNNDQDLLSFQVLTLDKQPGTSIVYLT